jgi:hypothetical protein
VADHSKTLQLVPARDTADGGKRSTTSRECQGNRTEWKREHDDPLGKEVLTEEGTNQDIGSEGILER